MKKWHFWVSIAAIILFGFIISRDFLARLAWQKYRSANLAIFLNRGDADLAMKIGNYYFNGGAYDLAKSEAVFKKAVKVNPKILWGHYQLARIYFIKGDFNKATEEINKELEFNPENLRSLYVRGLIYGYQNQAGDLAKSEADFRRFTEWAPKEWAGYNDLAWIQSKREKYEEAEKTINLALKEALDGENNPWLWNALGVAELNLKKYSDAADSFKKAKNLAEKLDLRRWRRSYPGNNPASAEEGLSAFISAIEENLRRAESKK